MSDFAQAMVGAAKDSNVKAVSLGASGVGDNDLWTSDRVLSFSDFCESADHMNFPPLSPKQNDVSGYMFGDDPKTMFFNSRNTAVLVWGKGSGKDTISAMMQLYVVYVLLNLSHPQRYLGLPDSASLDLLNVAACVTRDTLVKIDGGWKPVADITNGDFISTWDGRQQPVSKLFKFEDKPVFSAMLKNGMRIRCTDNHRFKVLEDGRWEEKELKDLSKGDVLWYGQGLSFGDEDYISRIKYKKRTCASPIFGESMVVTPDIAYMLGLAISDGYISKPSKNGGEHVGWVVPEHRPEIDSEVMRISEGSFGGRLNKSAQGKDVPRGGLKTVKDLYNYRLYSSDFCDHAINLGMKNTGKKGHKGFPWKVLSGSKESVRHLLAGMFDGDGSFGREIKYYSTSEEIIGWAAMALNGLGISTDMWFWNNIFHLIIPNSEADKFMSEVPVRRDVAGRIKDGQSSCLAETPPKPPAGTMAEALLASRVYSSKIFSIRPDGIEDVFDYEALPDKEMIANGIMSIDSKEQAQTVYFQILKTLVMGWKWLRNRYPIVINGRFFSSNQEEDNFLHKVTVTNDAIVFPQNIRAFSGSCEAETLEGKNLLMFVLDEADAFKQSSSQRSAAKIYRTVRTSAVSRFKKNYKGFIISYPRSSSGFIMKMYEQSKKFLNMYGDIGCTWEVKPRRLFSPETFEFEGDKVPMDFYDEFRLDPNGSKAAYLCRPPLAEAMFLEDPEKVDMASKLNMVPLFEFKDSESNNMVQKVVSKAPFMHDRTKRYTVILDLSLKRDTTVLTIGHRDGDKIIVDCTTGWEPDPKRKIEVDLQNVEDVIGNIKESVTVDDIFADHWNSALLIQKLRSRGIRSDTMKIDFSDYEMFKRLLYSGSIVLPKHTKMINEIKNLQMFSGKKVDHGYGKHNDYAVTVIMLTKALTTLGKYGDRSNLASEGEYVGDNLDESVDAMGTGDTISQTGMYIDGHHIQ
jgi:hypothetical protein